MSVSTVSHFESKALAKRAEAQKEDEDSATVYSINSNATTVKMNNRSRTFAGKAVANDDERRHVIAQEIERVMVDQQPSDLCATLLRDTSMVDFFRDRRAQFPSNAGYNEIADLALKYCRSDAEKTDSAGISTWGEFCQHLTGTLFDKTAGNFSVSASDTRRADEYAASVPVIDHGETTSSTRQTVVEQVRSEFAGLGLNTNNNPPTISTAASAAAPPPPSAGKTLDGDNSGTFLGRPIDIDPPVGDDSLCTESLTSTHRHSLILKLLLLVAKSSSSFIISECLRWRLNETSPNEPSKHIRSTFWSLRSVSTHIIFITEHLF